MTSLRSWLEVSPVLPPYSQDRPRLVRTLSKTITYTLIIVLAAIYGIAITLAFPVLAPLLLLPIVILFLVVLWALPDARGTPSVRAVGVGFLAYWVVFCCWPNYIALKLPGLPWISLQRLTAATTIVLFLFALSRWRENRVSLVRAIQDNKLVSYPTLLFFFAQTFAVLTGVNVMGSLYRVLDQAFTWNGMFFASALLLQNDKVRRRWILLFVGFGLAQAVLSIAEQMNKAVLWSDLLTRLPSVLQADPKMIESIVRNEIDIYSGRYRAKGIYNNSLSFAEFMAVASPFLLLLTVRARSFASLTVFAALNVLLITGLLMNGSRLGLVGTLSGYMLFLLLWSFDFWRTNRGNLIGPALVLAFPAGAAVLGFGMAFVGRINALFFGTGMQIYSTQARMDQFAKMPGVLMARPIFGYGPGNGGAALDYRQPGGLLTVDSYIITALLDYGIIGGLAFFGIMIGGAITATKIATRTDNPYRFEAMAAAAAVLTYFVVRTVLSQEENQPLLFILAGLILALVQKARALQPAALPQAAFAPAAPAPAIGASIGATRVAGRV